MIGINHPPLFLNDFPFRIDWIRLESSNWRVYTKHFQCHCLCPCKHSSCVVWAPLPALPLANLNLAKLAACRLSPSSSGTSFVKPFQWLRPPPLPTPPPAPRVSSPHLRSLHLGTSHLSSGGGDTVKTATRGADRLTRSRSAVQLYWRRCSVELSSRFCS